MKNKMKWLAMGICVLFVSTVLSVPVDVDRDEGKGGEMIDVSGNPNIKEANAEYTSSPNKFRSFGNGANSKSLYLIANHHANPTPINVYSVPIGIPSSPNNDLIYQDTYDVTSYMSGASGLAIWEDPNDDLDFDDTEILITYEDSGKIERFEAVNLASLGTVDTGASDLTGIVVDHDNKLVYATSRFSKNLFVIDPNGWSLLTTVALPLDNNGWGIALDENVNWLFVADNDETVHIFDTNTWNEIPGSPVTTESTYAISIAVDENNMCFYTGGAFYHDYKLAKYDYSTPLGTTSSVELGNDFGVIGLAVDSANGLVYVTTGFNDDKLRVFNKNLIEEYQYPDTNGMIINPADIIIPRSDFSYSKLRVEKEVSDDGGNTWHDKVIVPSGTEIEFRITVCNWLIDCPCFGLDIIDYLPPGLIYVQGSASLTPSQITPSLVWPLNVSLGYGQCFTLAFKAIAMELGVHINDVEATTLCCDVFVTEEDSATVNVTIPNATKADLRCTGELGWSDVKPGDTITGNFTVENAGDNGSQLDWKISAWPGWGNWTFIPMEGEDLSPKDGPIKVTVTVVAPEYQEQEFVGELTIVNKVVEDDFEIIPVSLTTPKNKAFDIPPFIQCLLEHHPILFHMLQELLIL